MTLQNRIKSLVALGCYIQSRPTELLNKITYAGYKNQWFTSAFVDKSLNNLSAAFLDENIIEAWIRQYSIPDNSPSKKIGIIAAGNIPLVSFHDVLCVLITGHQALIKLSEKDNVLLPFLLEKLVEIDGQWKENILYEDRWKNIDAVIATGGSNSGRYFEYYFGKYPHIIRKNRHSAAILTGNETLEELKALGNDVFDYFGLGCRNVSLLWIPEGYNFTNLLEAWAPFNEMMMHNGYKNNLDYQRTLYLMNGTRMIDCDYINMVDSYQLASPISCLHLAYYQSPEEIIEWENTNSNQIQCILKRSSEEHYIAFGKAQNPQIDEYADGMDTIQFLMQL